MADEDNKSDLEKVADTAVGMVAVWWGAVFVLWLYFLFVEESNPWWLLVIACYAYGIRGWWVKRKEKRAARDA